MKIRVTSQFTVRTNDSLSEHIDALMHSLVEVERENRDISESDVTAILSRGVVEMSTVVLADSWEMADQRSEQVFSSAIRLAGGEIKGQDYRSDAELTASIRSTEMIPA